MAVLVPVSPESPGERFRTQCRNCGLPPVLDFDRLLLRAPEGRTRRKIEDRLGALVTDLRYDPRTEELMIADLPHRAVAEALKAACHSTELLDVMVVPLAGSAAQLDDFRRMMRGSDYVAMVHGQWLIQFIEEGGLTNHVQPIVDAAGSVYGHEFLARGTDADGSPVPAFRMIEAASTPRLAAYFDRSARLEAVASAARLGPDGAIFINFLPSTVYDPKSCLKTTVAAVQAAGIAPERVVFEVVETEQITDLSHLRAIMDFYRDAGFRIALDDFGAGFNNLAHFIALDPDFIKIDKAITQAVVTSSLARNVVETLVQNAHAADVTVIAEGVEDADMWAQLQALGCDLFQGYHLGRPGPLPEA
ncbi:MAG: EAL domain-containing protein [Rhodothalassiaceae bacterium]